MEVVVSAADWQKIKLTLIDEFGSFNINGLQVVDLEVVKLIKNFDSLLPELSKAEVIAKTVPKYHKHRELLQNFNTLLQDCKEIMLIHVMTRN